MTEKIYLKTIACFMILLVLMLPLNSLSVYAESITKFYAKGEKSGVENYLAENERIVFVVLLDFAPVADLKDRVSMLNSNKGFTECKDFPTTNSQCTYTYPEGAAAGAAYVWESAALATHEATAVLYKDKDRKQEAGREEKEYTFDINRPEFVKKPAAISEIANKKYRISYEAIDNPCPGSTKPEDCAKFRGKCSGLKNILFFKDDAARPENLIGEVKLSDLGACAEAKSDPYELPEKFGGDKETLSNGPNAIIVVLSDWVGHTVTERIPINVDRNPPSVVGTFKIFKGGIEIKQRPPAGREVAGLSIHVEFSGTKDEDVKADTVKGIFKDINPSIADERAPNECSASGSNTLCKWEGIAITQWSSPLKFSIKAEDKYGNKLEDAGKGFKELSLSLAQEDKELAVDSISINNQQDQAKQYAKSSSNNIKIIFTEATGLAGSEIKLNQPQITQAPACAKKDQKFECVWQDVVLIPGKLTLDSGTKDILGNPLTGNKEVNVVIDTVSPIVESDNDIIIKNTGAEAGFIKTGTVNVIAYVKDENPLTAEADFTPFANDKRTITCSDAQEKDYIGYKLCKWDISFSNPGEQHTIEFKFTDAAGNAGIAEKEISVSGAVSGQVDYWKIKEKKCSPENIDRGAVLVIPNGMKSYCTVKLEPNGNLLADATKDAGTLKTVSIKVKDPKCSASGTQSYVSNAVVIRDTPGTIEPVVVLTFNKMEMPETEYMDIVCTLNIQSRILDTQSKAYVVNSIPEEEAVVFKMGLFELPDPAKAMREKIEKEKDSIVKWNKKLESFKKLMLFAQKICAWFNTFYKVMETLLTIAKILNAKAAAARIAKILGIPLEEKIGTIRNAVCHSEQTGQDVGHGLMKTFGKFCAYLTCDKTLWGNKILDVLDELPLASHMASVDMKLDKLDICVGGKIIGSDEPCTPATQEQKDAQKQSAEARGMTVNPPNSLARYMNPQNSLLGSMMFGCLPGIVYNADKFMQLKCRYVSCLEQYVAQGMDPAVCEQIKNQQVCKYVVGEVFFWLPHYQIWKHYQELIRQVLLNPFALGYVGVELISRSQCRQYCTNPSMEHGFAYYGCQIKLTLELVSKISATTALAKSQVQNFGDLNKQVSQEPCRQLGILEE